MIASLILAVAMQADLSTPEKTVRSAAALLVKHDFDGFMKCIDGKPPWDEDSRKMFKEILKGLNIQILSVTATIKGNTATLVVKEKVTTNGGPKGPGTETVNLKKTGSEWLILVPKNAGEGALSALAYMGARGSREIFATAKRAAQKTSALSNAKQVAICFMLYASDNKDHFPAVKDWKKLMMPYCKNEAIFHAPGVPKDPYSNFSFNANLAGVKDAKVQKPSETILIYLGKNGKLDFPYDGKTIVAFADSSAKALTKEQAAKLRWKP